MVVGGVGVECGVDGAVSASDDCRLVKSGAAMGVVAAATTTDEDDN